MEYTLDISVVSGTYNRLSYLQKMVHSVRHSVTGVFGLLHEIVIVDGGSNDGTQDWCRQQEDIRLIEHNELRGAIAAFNDGAYAAIGKYVIMANDDIEFVGNSIYLAYVYMETHTECGGGCFYQNRNNRDWHIEYMPAVTKERKQVHVPYAQVGIFPRWLGNLVGWWCRDEDFALYLTQEDFRQINDGRIGLHTYGGDNELSAKIIDLGYSVSPVPNAKITDKEAEDDLRKINNIADSHDPRSVRGHHPDSWKWGKRWFRRNQRLGYKDLAGPILKDTIMIQNPTPETKERVLYLPLFEQGWQVLKEQKKGLREALAKVATVVEYDYMRQFASIGQSAMMKEIFALCVQLQPTVFLSQLHNSEQINSGDLKNLRSVCGDRTRFVNWNGDYWPNQLLDEDGLSLARSFDLMTVVNRDVVQKHQAQGINTEYWQIGWEPLGRNHEPYVYHDVVFLASGYSEKRQRLGRLLMEQQVNFGLYGHGWPDKMAKGECLYDFVEACKIYRGAKLAIGDSQWPESGFVSNRIFQILAAGNCVLCHQWFKDCELLGLIDGVNCIIWQDFNDLRTKLKYWLSDMNLHQISLNGEKLALASHSFDARVSELWQMLKIDVTENWRW